MAAAKRACGWCEQVRAVREGSPGAGAVNGSSRTRLLR